MSQGAPNRPFRTSHTKDARGRSVGLLDPYPVYLLGDHDLIPRDTLRTIINEKGVKISPWQRVALCGGLLGALTVITFYAHGLITGDLRNAPLAKSAGLLYLCSLPWIVWFGIKYKRLDHVATAMLKHRRCPHCGYDLRLLPTADDGATVCPECGCAWRLPDQRTTVKLPEAAIDDRAAPPSARGNGSIE